MKTAPRGRARGLAGRGRRGGDEEDEKGGEDEDEGENGEKIKHAAAAAGLGYGLRERLRPARVLPGRFRVPQAAARAAARARARAPAAGGGAGRRRKVSSFLLQVFERGGRGGRSAEGSEACRRRRSLFGRQGPRVLAEVGRRRRKGMNREKGALQVFVVTLGGGGEM